MNSEPSYIQIFCRRSQNTYYCNSLEVTDWFKRKKKEKLIEMHFMYDIDIFSFHFSFRKSKPGICTYLAKRKLRPIISKWNVTFWKFLNDILYLVQCGKAVKICAKNRPWITWQTTSVCRNYKAMSALWSSGICLYLYVPY